MGNFEEENEFYELRDNLLTELFKDAEMPQNAELSRVKKDEFLRVLMITHMGEAASEKLILAQDKFLKFLNEKNKIGANKLKFKNNICLVDGNILDYDADLLVVGSTNAFEDVENLMAGKQSLDNDLLFRAGIELKAELLKNANKMPNLIFAKGYNLNAKYLAKIVLPNAANAQNFGGQNNAQNYISTKNIAQNVTRNENAKNEIGQHGEVEYCNELLKEKLYSVFEFLKEKELKSVAIDVNSITNLYGLKESQKFFKELKKTIENSNKKTKAKIILKNFY